MNKKDLENTIGNLKKMSDKELLVVIEYFPKYSIVAQLELNERQKLLKENQ